MSDVTSQIVSYSLSLLALVIGALLSIMIRKVQPYVLSYLDTKTSKQVQDIAASIFRQAYSMAEKEFKSDVGQVKFDNALMWGIGQLKDRGINITLEQAKGFTQDAWQIMEGQIKKADELNNQIINYSCDPIVFESIVPDPVSDLRPEPIPIIEKEE